MLDYSGASLAGLAWVAWRRSSGAPTAGLAEAERLAQAALEAWQQHGAPYPFYWQALWPLIGVALARERPADALTHARRLLEPGQQLLPPGLAALIQAAVDAWDAGRAAAAAESPPRRPRSGATNAFLLITFIFLHPLRETLVKRLS